MSVKNSHKQFCIRGHDTFICGRSNRGQCKDCRRERDRKNYKAHPRNPTKFCSRGHNKDIVGRHGKGGCIGCQKENYLTNRDLILVKVRKYRKAHRKNIKNWNFIRKYGISIEDYNILFKKQKGKCAGCGEDRKNLKRDLAVDHNHETGQVRGLLCDGCNLFLGKVKDDVNILKKLIRYLNKYKKRNK